VRPFLQPFTVTAVAAATVTAPYHTPQAVDTEAPCKGEIPGVQIEDLCEGCISLSNAEGLGLTFRKENGLSFHSADIIGLQKISSLIDRQKSFQRVPADNGLAPHFEDGQLSPFHQLPHGVPADTRTFCGFLYGKSHFDCAHSINLLFRMLILQLLFYHYTYSAISCQPILQPFIVYLQLLLK